MAFIKKFVELQNEYLTDNDTNSLNIFKELFAHWLFFPDQTLREVYLPDVSSENLVLVDNILSRLGYHHYSIITSDPEVMIIKLRNSL